MALQTNIYEVSASLSEMEHWNSLEQFFKNFIVNYLHINEPSIWLLDA